MLNFAITTDARFGPWSPWCSLGFSSAKRLLTPRKLGELFVVR